MNILYKPKVAVLLHGLGPNGIDTLFANLSETFSDKVDIYYFLAVDKDSPQFWEERVKHTGVHLIKLHDLDKGRLKKWPKTLYRALKEFGPFDAVHTNMDMLNGINLIVAKLCGVNVRISHAHRGSSDKSSNICRQKLADTYRWLMKKLMAVFSTKKLACSDTAGEYFFKKGKYTLLYNGINLIGFDGESSNPVCERDVIRFCTVGRIEEVKNPYKIADIFAAITKRVPKAELTWIGNGSQRDEVMAYVETLGQSDNVKFIKQSDHVADYLLKSSYFLLPSRYEGLSLALAEAQSAGLDCFVSDTCSRLSDCGKCMFIPLDNTPQQWADTIIAYINGSEKMMLSHELMDRFDIKKVARRLENIYLGLPD